MRVLVAAALEPFLRATDLPLDVEPIVLREAAAVPAGEFAGILTHVARRIGEEEIARVQGLRVIANFGVGYDNVDIAAARRRGIAVTNTPDVLTGATAELTWALILATARRVTEGDRLVRAGGWTGWTPTQLLGFGLEGRTLGIVGAGRIGQEVAHRARAFGMRVLYSSPTRRTDFERSARTSRVELDALLASSDVVSLHVPFTPETRNLIDEAALRRMQPHAVLINTSRGAVIDESALIVALESGILRGAGLDVYVDEPRVPARLRALPNVVLLPHLGSATEEARTAMWRLAWRNLLCGVRGEQLPNPVF